MMNGWTKESMKTCSIIPRRLMTFCLMVLALEVLRECPMGVENKKGTNKSGGERIKLHSSEGYCI